MKPNWHRIIGLVVILVSAGIFFAPSAYALQIRKPGIASFDADIVVSTMVNTRHLSLRAGSSKRFFRGQLHKMVAVPIFLFSLEMCKTKNKKFNLIEKACEYLSRFYLPVRYPDALAGVLPEGLPNQEEAKKAVVFAEEIVEFVKKILGVN